MSASVLILLVLWGGGFGCLWCCASDLPDKRCDQRSAVMIHNGQPSCSSHRRCCESTESNQRAAIKETSPSAAAHCCLTGAHTSGPAALPQSQPQQALAATIIEPLAPVVFGLAASPLISSAPPANKGSTYLRCCVFLI